MNWKKLLTKQCPKCSKELDFYGDFWYCMSDSCDFAPISRRKFEEEITKIENDTERN